MRIAGLWQLVLNAAMMSWIWSATTFLGIDWHFWKVIGWLGNIAFFSRFVVQWHASERQKRVVVPVSFWWLSLAGSGLLLSYALFHRKDSVFIFAYAFTWIPYLRNLVLHHRGLHSRACEACSHPADASAKFCSNCGKPLMIELVQKAG
jgi:lipid-A-disaccharide synthase-like uncharacterized protein